jgi:ATP-dependent DNA helicase PIF1
MQHSHAVPKQSVGISEPYRGTQHNPLEIASSPEPEKVGKSKKKMLKYYAVAVGHVTGVYGNWDDVQLQVRGYSGAKHKSFRTGPEAKAWLEEYQITSCPTFDACTGFATINPERSTNTHQNSALIRPSSSPRFTEELYPQSSQHGRATDSSKMGHPPMADVNEGRPFSSTAQVATMPKVNEISLEPEPVLKPEQQKVVDLILEGHNVFYTGSAGCGKSTILKAFVKQLTLRGKRVKIVAPTNLAALNVGGVTTWSFAGWTPDSMKKPLAALMKNASGTEVWERFDKTDVLVIDEISMVENLLFERLNHIMKASIGEKRGGGPFGGVQVIVTGDFCQLSPVRPFQHCIGCGWELIRDNQWRPKEQMGFPLQSLGRM